MTDYTIGPATAADGEYVHDHIRIEDLREWRDGSGKVNIRTMIAESSIRPSSWVAKFQGEPLVVGGTEPIIEAPGFARGWMVATVKAPLFVYGLHYLLDPYLKGLDADYDAIYCWADARNHVHHKWIVWLGFDLLGEVPFGPNNVPFYEFERLSHVRSGNRASDGGRCWDYASRRPAASR